MADRACDSRNGPLRMPPALRIFAGAWLVVLVSLVLNDPRQPVPLAVAAIMVTLVVLGKAAFGGARWLIRESDVRFPEGINPIPPKALVAKLVPWIGFGASMPAAWLVTMAFLIGFRPPLVVGHFVGMLLYSFIPTLMVCLALMPTARAWSGELATDRDRGVFPLATGMMLYAVCGYFFLFDNPFHHGFFHMLWHVVVVAFKSVLPYHWPQHVIAAAVAFVCLRGWFSCTACATVAPQPTADTPQA